MSYDKQSNLEEFEKMLKGHDWYYRYSEDRSYYRRGRSESESIQLKLKELKENGFGDEALKLFNQYNPNK